jgi:tetratricopeptide (TPR) repeat protein
LWLLPVALQLAGRFDAAVVEFAKVAEGSPHWEEAQYRWAVCGRRAVEATRSSAGAEAYAAAAHKAAEALGRYADEALARSDSAVRRDEIRTWSAEARVSAAELLISERVGDGRGALAAVGEFETRYPQSELLGRVLAVRIRAYRGLHEFEQASKMLAEFLRATPPEQVGGTLATLAQGMQDEVERLVGDAQSDAARALAADSLATFDELEKWVRADARRGQSLEYVLAGRARMLYLAGQYDEALKAVTTLLDKSPKNGNSQHLLALTLTARLATDAPREELTRAQEAWAALLADASLPQRAPERYWEARYNWLALTLRMGDAADVEKAITQERIWRPELGGSPWRERLQDLLRAAQAALGRSPESAATESQPEP